MEDVSKKLEEINERLEFIEFRQELLFGGTDIDRILYEYKITQKEYQGIMNEMDRLREEIDNGNKVDNSDFEQNIYEIVNHKPGIEYHFCEYITKVFMEDRRWEEVFFALYGDMPKYKHLKEGKNY